MVNTHLDEDPKTWRYNVDIILELSTLLEVLSPFFPGYFLLVASIANVGKNTAWLLGAGSRVGIHKSLCKEENLGDVTTKNGSQTTFATLFGTALGICISPFIGSNPIGLFTSFFICACIHLGCLYYGISHISINTLNWQRGYYLNMEYINKKCVSIPSVIGKKEKCFFPHLTVKIDLPVILGYPLQKSFNDPNLFLRRLELLDNKYTISLINEVYILIFRKK